MRSSISIFIFHAKLALIPLTITFVANGQRVIIQNKDSIKFETKIISLSQRYLTTMDDGDYYYNRIAKIYFLEDSKNEKYLISKGIKCLHSIPENIKLTSPKEKADANEFYEASNGERYRVGDTIKLGRGSGVNGQFLYVQMGGWLATMGYNQDKGQDQLNLPRGIAGTKVVVKKIKRYTYRGTVKYSFVVGGGNITNYNLDIESAIETCEVVPCKPPEPIPVTITQPKPDKYDQLKKLKELLDSGAITKEEYEIEKKKVLDGN